MFVLRGLSKRRYLGPVFGDLSIRYAESGSESDPRKTNISVRTTVLVNNNSKNNSESRKLLQYRLYHSELGVNALFKSVIEELVCSHLNIFGINIHIISVKPV